MSLKLSDIYQSYIASSNISNQNKSNIKTALFKYTLPELGFIMPKRSANRLHPGDAQLAIAFCSDIYLDADSKKTLTEAQENYFKKITPAKHLVRHNRRALKDFLSYLNEAVKQNDLPVKEKKKYQYLRFKVKDLSNIENAKKRKKRKAKIALSFDVKDYSKKPLEIKRELKRIKTELSEFKEYLPVLHNSKISIDGTMVRIKALLGWQYLKTKNLSEVGLEKLVIQHNIYPQRIDNTKISNQENYINYMVAKSEALEQGKDYAKKTIELVEEFFKGYQVTEKGTKTVYIKALINVAKFLYKDITDREENTNYEDISVIKRLRVLNNNLPKKDIQIQSYLPNWETIIKVLYELKRCSNQEYYSTGKRIEDIARSHHLRNFLILGFFTLVPPARQRVIRELQLGKTLKYGKYINSIFVSYEELENKSEAKFYIHLQPEDYKTGHTYGEWLGEFPNFKFSDETYFYDYLNLWINKYREIMLEGNKDHGYLFMGRRNKKPLDADNLGSIIKHIFLSKINLAITPHKLRTIYRTHLADIGADQQTLESSAFWMRHSPEMARDTYTKQTLENKLAPGMKAIAKINQELRIS